MRIDCVADVFGGVSYSIEDGTLNLKTVDVLRVLEMNLSEVLVPLDEIARVRGNVELVESDLLTTRSLIDQSTSKHAEELRSWLNAVAVPMLDLVREYERKKKG